MRFAIIGLLLAGTQAGFACEFPNEGNMPLRRAVTRVEMLPQVHEWHRDMVEKGASPQYLVRLDAPVRRAGRCYWTVEARAGGKLWRSFLVTPDGKHVRPME
jgi:hypothetical protein